MLPLTVQATREVIYHLIAQNGKTTTLDVKNELRNRTYNASRTNYRATQRGKSSADFINKLKNVEEELDEAIYWLELIEDVG